MTAILIYGNPVDGFAFVGPFDDAELAADYATSIGQIRDSSWWTTEVEAPDPAYLEG